MKKYLLLIILIVAATFRLIGLTMAPPGLNWDEVSIGYNAYSILKTGRDEWGEFLPLAFKAFGEVKLPGMIYASIPAIALFGETDFGVRATPAIIGIIGVCLIYFLGKELFGKKEYGLVSAALLAISPWGVHFSRVSFEAGLAMVLTMFSVYCLLRAKEKPSYFWPAMLAAVFALYTYNSVRILLPLLFLSYLVLGIIKITKSNTKTLISVIVVGLILVIPSVTNILSKGGQIRWGTVSITGQKGFFDDVAASRGYTSSLPEPLPRIVQNKVTHYIFALANNYIQTFSSEFLFFKGSTNTQRSVQGMGMLYLFELPLLIIGISQLIGKDKSGKSAALLLLPWLLLAPIPSAITTDAPSSVRTLGILPALLLTEALGSMAIIKYLRTRSKIFSYLALAFIVWNISYFGYQLWLVNPVKYADNWLYGQREMMQFVTKNENNVDSIYITSKYGEPYIYALFYSGYDPAKYQTETVVRNPDPTGWVHVYSFGKFHFTDFGGLETPKEILARHKGRIMMIDGFATLPGEYHRDLEIKAPNWIMMFEGTIQNGQNPN
ncbi:MAG: glycosyltransferase family 39 protein [bacterium]